jgi:NAD(P)-dependent dehydrogenase (short-subunit alcohol dehydrogenase family)
MKSVVVTGVSTGIGWGIAKVLLANGFRVYGSVRKRADADRLKAEFGANFVPLLFDVTDEAAVLATAREVRATLKGETLSGLVNNAGISVSGPLLELSLDDFCRQIEVNLTGQLIVTQAFAPLLGADTSLKGEPGRILMMSSVAGRRALPFLGPYAASKHALEGLSESLRREMMLFGIKVIIIGPGAVKTPIWDKAGGIEIAARKNSPYLPALERVRVAMLALGKQGLPPERVGELVHRVLTMASPRVRYAIVPNRLQYFISKLLPRRILDRMIARRLGLQRTPASS